MEDHFTSSQEFLLNKMLAENGLPVFDNLEEAKPFQNTDMFEGIQLPGFAQPSNLASATGTLPAIDDYPGPLDFGIVTDKPTGKNWEFSSVLKKVYLKFNSPYPVVFHYNASLSMEDLHVRALLMYIEAEDAQSPVRRCQHHMAKTDKSNENFDFLEHVVRADSLDAYYFQDQESERMSVLVPLRHPQPGTTSVTIMFRFLCKNSCPSGMNRRPTMIIFTLENYNGDVLGRSKMLVRVCSCPKRDKEKDENDFAILKNNIQTNFSAMQADRSKRRSQPCTSKVKKPKLVVVDSDAPITGNITCSEYTQLMIPCVDSAHMQDIMKTTIQVALGSLLSRAVAEGRELNARELALQEHYNGLLKGL